MSASCGGEGPSLKKADFATLNIPLSIFLRVIILWWLGVVIYHGGPLSSERIYRASSLCQLHQDFSQLHKHFTDKDGQLFTDEAKVLLAAATVWAEVCVFPCACQRVCVCV